VPNLFLDMIKSTAAEVILTSKFKSDLSLLVLMNFYFVNCASKILNPVGAPELNYVKRIIGVNYSTVFSAGKHSV